MNEVKKYFVGFDIGTSSVGWAVTDEEYKLCKFNGHKMWGVRLFDEPESGREKTLQGMFILWWNEGRYKNPE